MKLADLNPLHSGGLWGSFIKRISPTGGYVLLSLEEGNYSGPRQLPPCTSPGLTQREAASIGKSFATF